MGNFISPSQLFYLELLQRDPSSLVAATTDRFVHNDYEAMTRICSKDNEAEVDAYFQDSVNYGSLVSDVVISNINPKETDLDDLYSVIECMSVAGRLPDKYGRSLLLSSLYTEGINFSGNPKFHRRRALPTIFVKKASLHLLL